MKQGWIKIYHGPMFAGKSAAIIKDILNNPKEKLIFKPNLDTTSNFISSRDGTHHEALIIKTSEEILNKISDKTEIVYIDEINFFDKTLNEVVKKIRDLGIDVVLSGLSKDYRGEYFDHTEELLKLADEVIVLEARCHICGQPSQWTARFVNGKPDSFESETNICAGEKAEVKYITTCKKHHPFKGEK